MAGDRDRQMVKDALRFWQSYTQEELTPEDAKEIRKNAVAFITLLNEWDQKEKAEGRSQ